MFRYRVAYDSDYEKAQVVQNELKNLRLECNLLNVTYSSDFTPMSRYVHSLIHAYSGYIILYNLYT